MNILLIHQYFLEEDDPGGSRFNEMAKTWSEMGHNITVLAGMMHYAGHKKRPEYKGKWITKRKQGKTTVWRCFVSESYNVNFLGRLWGYLSFVISSFWAGLFKAKGKYDVILVTSPPLFIGITAYLLSLFKRTPYIFEIRDLWPESAIDTGVIKNKTLIKVAYWVENFLYKKAMAINVLTPAFREKLIEYKKVPQSKIIFIPNAADFTLSDDLLMSFDPKQFRREQGVDGKFIITYVGAHGVANHLIQLIETAELLKEYPILIQLIGDGMEKPKLVREAERRGLDNIKFVDPVPKKDVFKYIMASDVGASVLKKVDTFKTIYSNKTFDYMACKKPILMVIDGISRALIEEANCGVYAEPEDHKAIATAILSLYENNHENDDIGNNGYQFAKENFDRNVLARKYVKEIEERTNNR
ncbi:MAG: glycosyltransferase family 4 protein [Cytophagales bacterium]|nr:glycosyltransferase family 4 protein [Cytophagales bacterium]